MACRGSHCNLGPAPQALHSSPVQIGRKAAKFAHGAAHETALVYQQGLCNNWQPIRPATLAVATCSIVAFSEWLVEEFVDTLATHHKHCTHPQCRLVRKWQSLPWHWRSKPPPLQPAMLVIVSSSKKAGDMSPGNAVRACDPTPTNNTPTNNHTDKQCPSSKHMLQLADHSPSHSCGGHLFHQRIQ